MNRPRSLQLLLTALALATATVTGAQQVTLGINAGVTTRDSVRAQEAKFAPLAQAASRALHITLQVTPVKSPDVAGELKAKHLDLLVIHTNDALAAVKKEGYALLALSQDLKDDRIRFMVASGGPTQLSDARGKRIWSAGATSFATAVGMAVLRSQGVAAKDVTLKITSYQDAMPFMLQNGFGEVAVTRVDSVAGGWEKQGGRIVYSTERLPVYAVVAKPGFDPALAERLGSWMVGLSKSDDTSRLLTTAGLQGFRAAPAAEIDALARWFGL